LGQLAVRFLIESQPKARTPAASVAIFELDVPAGAKVPIAHSHDAYEETIYGIEGVITFTLEGRKIEIGPGDALCIPRYPTGSGPPLRQPSLRHIKDARHPQPRHPHPGNPSKINLEKAACFSSRKSDRQLTTFHQQSTTTSPSKHHVLHPVFAKTPSKNGVEPARKKLLQQRSLFGWGLGFFGWDDDAAPTLPWGSRARAVVPATRANSPTTENSPGMAPKPNATKVSPGTHSVA
jgi:hypothetical protein